jgi:hypothetical protein
VRCAHKSVPLRIRLTDGHTWHTRSSSKPGATVDDPERTGRTILALGDRVVVKVPTLAEDFPAAARLTRGGANVLPTAV